MNKVEANKTLIKQSTNKVIRENTLKIKYLLRGQSKKDICIQHKDT